MGDSSLEIFDTQKLDMLVAHQLFILNEYALAELKLHFFADDYYMVRLRIRSMIAGILFSSKMTRAIYEDAESREHLMDISEEEADEAIRMIEAKI